MIKLKGYCLALLLPVMIQAQPVQLPAKLVAAKKTETQRLRQMADESMAQPLADSTAFGWQSAFWAMELLQYKPDWAQEKLKEGFAKFNTQDDDFKRAFLEWIYTNYKGKYVPEMRRVFDTIRTPKLKAMSGEYLLEAKAFTKAEAQDITQQLANRLTSNPDTNNTGAFTIPLLYKLSDYIQPNLLVLKKEQTELYQLLQPTFLPGRVVVYSFQRPDRNYPGLVLVRNAKGQFIKTGNQFFAVPQLARSISNLPGYITNGNTPTGIMRMKGFGISKNTWIGPSENLQLSLPGELDNTHFFNDSTLNGMGDSLNISMDLYKKLLPQALSNSWQLHLAFWAGRCGRTEIIAHGTTINPDYYKGTPYYPQTPTMGCLCTRESWDSLTGKRMYSDQQKLVNAVKQAGGADGYFVVVELNDVKKPVTLTDVLPYLKKAGQR
jgi:hypothetical protein